LAVRLVGDQAVPGVRDLFQALVEERARRFVRQLNAAASDDRLQAEAKIRALASSKSGEKVLMHVARECFFGSERLSLAAMAVLISEHDLNPSYSEIAARALEGFADLDALTFLVMVSRPKACRPMPSKWRPGYVVDVKVVREPDWDVARNLVGISEEVLFTAVTECIRRKILMPDSASARLGSEKDLALRHFCTSRTTLAFYRTLHRALEIVEPTFPHELQLFSPEFALESWWPKGTDEALAAAGAG
jgi:hypothetical protein